MKSALLLFALAATGPSHRHQPLVPVPFVGCPSDGQQGPQPVPKHGRVPKLPPSEAALLAYYVGPEIMGNLGVLAPRAWHCVALYGSNGSQVIVTQSIRRPDDFLSERTRPIRGPAVQIALSYAGTSGRFDVVPEVLRYFPRYRAYVTDELKSGLDFGVLPSGPYKTDIVERRTAKYLRFTTPAKKTGEGTNSDLIPGKLPIRGIRKIVGSPHEPDLIGVEVRLPPNLISLTDVILAQASKL